MKLMSNQSHFNQFVRATISLAPLTIIEIEK